MVTDSVTSQLMSNFARTIRELRHQRRLSARELAEGCMAAGAPSLTRSTIAKIESGVRRFITLDEVAALAQALEVAPHELMRSAVDPVGSWPDYEPVPADRPAGAALPRSRAAAGLPELATTELKALHKGRGMQASDLDSRLGPCLRELSSGPHGDDIATRRQVLATELIACAGQLAPDLRQVITASLALSGEASKMPNFADRVRWLAAQLGCEGRTALRRIHMAEALLAEQVTQELRRRRGRTATTPVGWYLDELRVLLRLDTPTPESYEDRRIVATSADLEEVVAWADVPARPGASAPDLDGEVTYGGQLIRREHPSGGKFQFIVRLPRTLQPGDQHEYGLHLRVSAREQMSPHVTFTPECRCDTYDLRIRFGLDQIPGWIRRVEGETIRMFEAAQPGTDLLTPDTAGEVHAQFRHPAMYLGYGIQWEQQKTGTSWETHG